MTDVDPFRHHPELRGKVMSAADSFFRNLELDLIDIRAAEAGENPMFGIKNFGNTSPLSKL
jgi:hypothetical protein